VVGLVVIDIEFVLRLDIAEVGAMFEIELVAEGLVTVEMVTL
jgi:hypothetical protein